MADEIRPNVRFRTVLGTPWFWLNYALTLLVTCWIPLMTLRAELKIHTPDAGVAEEWNTAAIAPGTDPPALPQPDGVIVRESVRSVPVYEAYGQVLRGQFRYYWRAVALHLLICFAVSFWVWYAVLRSRNQAA